VPESQRDGGSFDLAISEVVMPGISGIELARHLRDTHPELLVPLISGYPRQDGDQGLEGAGALFLAKPFRPSALRVCVRQILDQREAS
jgi:DNA-binding response OmpR family regulator